MRLLVLEFINGGGLRDTALPPNLQVEGALMLMAMLRDCQAIPSLEVYTLRDDRLPPLSIPSIRTIPVAAGQFETCWQSTLQAVDAVIIVAPETANILANLSDSALQQGCQLLGCPPAVVRLCSSKSATAAHLTAHGIPVIETLTQLPTEANENGWVLKPDDGVDCEAIYWYTDTRSLQKHFHGGSIIQPFLKGQSPSLTLLFHAQGVWLASVNEQIIVRDGNKFVFQGSRVNGLYDELYEESQKLAEQIYHAIPDIYGWTGVDTVMTQQGLVVLEINPRLTTSCVGLSESLGLNFMQLLLEGPPHSSLVQRQIVTVQAKTA